MARSLTRAASDTRRTIAQLGNAQGVPGSQTRPRRLLSDDVLPVDIDFAYLSPDATNVVPSSEDRAVTSINVVPFGVETDVALITSPDAEDRRVRTALGAGLDGLAPHPDDDSILVPAAVTSDFLHSGDKLSRVVERMTTQQGPAFHVVVDREGSVRVCMSLDDHGAAQPDSEVTVDVAVEAIVGIRRIDYQNRAFNRPDSFIELPLSPRQVTSLSVVVAKIFAAYPGVPRAVVEVGADGVRYRWSDRAARGEAQPYNFTTPEVWQDQLHSPFTYENSDAAGFLARVNQELSGLDLATQVFRPPGAAAATGAREVARTAISQADTAGAASVQLGHYSGLAGTDRASAMQASARQRFFVDRITLTRRDVDTQTRAAADVVAAQPAPQAAAIDVSPHVYDFATGRWQNDGSPV
jgi:hypothetical protein